MSHLPKDASDEAILAFVDQWVALLEAEKYDEAFAFTKHWPSASVEWLRNAMVFYADDRAATLDSKYGAPNAKRGVTLHGQATFKNQEKEVTRFQGNAHEIVGHVWYDLNFNGFVSDVTATFNIHDDGQGLTVTLEDIYVH